MTSLARLTGETDKLGNSTWPSLPLAEWRTTYATLHRWTQIVGKTKLALCPFVNHFWHVALHVSAQGLSTSAIPLGGGAVLDIEFDFVSHACIIRVSRGATLPIAIPLFPRSVADFYRAYLLSLHDLGIDLELWPMPVEIAEDPIPFDQDEVHCSYEREAVERFFGTLCQVDGVLRQFRSGFVGKASPVHFFWGSFDLAASRFSGRRAPDRSQADAVTREAYSHEVYSCGFWPGGSGVEMPSFYAYASPEPAGFARTTSLPTGAFYNDQLNEFLLPYEAVRTAEDPETTLLSFCRSTYEAVANLGHWDRAALEHSPAAVSARRIDRLGPTVARELHNPGPTGAPP